MGEHFSKLNNRHKDSILVKHWKNFHQARTSPPKFKVKVLSSHLSATERQVAEAIRIEDGGYDNLLNSKAEWGANKIPRQKLVVEDQIQEAANVNQISQMSKRGQKRGPDEEPSSEKHGPDFDSSEKHTETTFSTQYSQRKKARRLENKKQRISAGELVVEAHDILAENARKMRKGRKRLAEDQDSTLDSPTFRKKGSSEGYQKNTQKQGTQSLASSLSIFQLNPT